MNLTRGSLTDASAAWPSFLEPAITIAGLVADGALLLRVVLGGAYVTIGNDTYAVFREFVQPYNFSAVGERISFLTPTVSVDSAREITDANGYGKKMVEFD